MISSVRKFALAAGAIVIALLSSCRNTGPEFVLVTDVVPDAILEIRYYSTYNFIGDRIPGYEEPVAILTRQAADSLKAVSDELLLQGYIAEKSGHTRGSTIDLTLFDMKMEKEVDMGCTFDYFGVASHPDVLPGQEIGSYKPITEEQYRNRMILRDAMLRHGFRPYDCEWWHFTLENEPYPDTYFNFPIKADISLPL